MLGQVKSGYVMLSHVRWR